jgi:predicted RNase H-like HicB family nuclease
MKKELLFEIEQDEGTLVAVCHDPEMATQGETLEELLAMIRDLVQCRFDSGDERREWPVRLHFVHDPVLQSRVA